MRPLRLRNSSVSIANHIFSSSRACFAAATTLAASAPRAALRAAASTTMPRPPAAVDESITCTRSPPLPSRSRASRAWRADSWVPDSPPEMWIDTTSRPSARSGS